MSPQHTPDVLVTGATGYIGSRLVTALLDAGYPVRVLTRSPDKVAQRPWAERVDVCEGDADDLRDVQRAMRGMQVAYYLLHSMGDAPGQDFADRERAMAETFALAAQAEGIERIVYLGGLHPHDEDLSSHLASRVQVGEILLNSGVPAAVLQAAVILGSGSASFEMLRHLSERLPAMVAPKWLMNRIQPIAVRDVMHYLVAAATLPPEVNRTLDIGGPEVLTYRQMIDRFCQIDGLTRRLIVTVPVLTPRLAGHWVGLVTPVPGGLAQPLVESLVHEVICTENDIDELASPPPGGAMGFADAVRAALAGTDTFPDTFERDDDRASSMATHQTGDPDWAQETIYSDAISSTVKAAPERVWDVVSAVGGEHGWYVPDAMWQARGLADRVVGGPGLRRGRPARELQVGDQVDHWQVEEIEPGRRLLLRTEMRLPGQAWLEFEIDAAEAETGAGSGPRTMLRQRAVFRPRGLSGHLYWNGMLLGHLPTFRIMHRGMVNAAQGGI